MSLSYRVGVKGWMRPIWLDRKVIESVPRRHRRPYNVCITEVGLDVLSQGSMAG